MANFIGGIVFILFLVLMSRACVGLIAGPDEPETEEEDKVAVVDE